MLLLSNDDVSRVLPIADCLPIAERAYAELSAGNAVNRPRVNLSLRSQVADEYILKTWDAASPSAGVAAVRLSSDLLRLRREGERVVEEILPAAPGGRYTGFVILFSLATTEPLALIHDARIAHLNTSVAVGLAAKHLAREDAAVVAMLGSGGQARQQIQAVAAVRRLSEVRVYSPSQANRERFVAELGPSLGVPIRAVEHPRDAVAGADVVVSATNSLTPVYDAAWLRPGVHLSMTRPTEAPHDVYTMTDLFVSVGPDRPLTYAGSGAGTLGGTRPPAPPIDLSRVVPLMDVVGGRAPGRTSPDQTSLYGTLTGFGVGILYPALGAEALRRAIAAGLGQDIPTKWFLQTEPS